MDAFTQPIPTPLRLLTMRFVTATLDHTGGNVSEAARCLGIPRRTLTRWLKTWQTCYARSGVQAPQASPCIYHASHRLVPVERAWNE